MTPARKRRLEAATRKPLPPDVLASALQDRAHPASGRLISATPIARRKEESTMTDKRVSHEEAERCLRDGPLATVARYIREQRERDESIDCGQDDGVCAKSPGCTRHWEERFPPFDPQSDPDNIDAACYEWERWAKRRIDDLATALSALRAQSTGELVDARELAVLRATKRAWDARCVMAETSCACTHARKCPPCSEYRDAVTALEALERGGQSSSGT